MVDYVSNCLQAIRHGLADGTRAEVVPYSGSTTQVALYNAASEAVRIVLFGKRGAP